MPGKSGEIVGQTRSFAKPGIGKFDFFSKEARRNGDCSLTDGPRI
jgi:hypothetical protein